MFVLRPLLWLWALPLTVLGLPLFALAIAQRKRQTCVLRTQYGTVFTAHSTVIAKLLAWHPLGRMEAVAIGCCILARDSQALTKHLPHELVHVRQAQLWGVFFPLAYGASSAWQVLHGRCAYADNYFEQQANAACS